MDILEKLFGNVAKIKIIKLFLFNPETSYDVSTVASKSQVTRNLAKREMNSLERAGFIKEKSYTKEVRVQKNRRMVSKTKRADGYMLNYKFVYLEALHNFLSGLGLLDEEELKMRLGKGVKLDLLIVSGIFIKNLDSRIDLLIVGENIKENVLEKIIKDIESEIGREIRYSIFSTTEFKYRLSVFDKLIRDILDYPHKKLVNKLLV